MHLSRQKKHILSGIKRKLLTINDENPKYKETVNEILSHIDLHLKQNGMEGFEKYFIEVHPEFFNQLKQKYPDLTPGELKICAFVRLNLSSKEIANLTNKSLRSVENSRTTIRKKNGAD
jgi:DNA-binding NarL/FixJ family response regulator